MNFAGQRVGVIGTGSSAIQAIPVIAEQAGHLTVFQRTPNFSVPACNAPLDPAFVDAFKANYPGAPPQPSARAWAPASAICRSNRIRADRCSKRRPASRRRRSARCSKNTGASAARTSSASIADTMMNQDTNRIVADFVRDKIRAIVKDPATADALCPTSHPIGTKRICVDSDYYETYNRPNVKLVNLRDESDRAHHAPTVSGWRTAASTNSTRS